MSIFGTNDSSPMTQDKHTAPDQINLVGEGTVFEGTLRAESDVRTSGRILGRLEVEGKAIVAESGSVEGEIDATDADVAGHVQGEIYVEDQLVLKSTAHVDGDISTDRLIVEEGAVFTGSCTMNISSDEQRAFDSESNSETETAASAPSHEEESEPHAAEPADASPVAQ